MKPRIAKECEVWYDKEKYRSEVIDMESAEKIRILREKTGLSRKDFSIHIGIPLRTVEEWEAGRRRPPEYVPRLIEYQLKYEELISKKQKEEQDAEE